MKSATVGARVSVDTIDKLRKLAWETQDPSRVIHDACEAHVAKVVKS